MTAAPITADAVAHTRTPHALQDYWTRGAGAAKIRWGEGNDWYRCVEQLAKYVHNPHMVKGQCNSLHKIATGMWPATHDKILHGGDGPGKVASSAAIVAGHPYPGQRYRHGWIPVAGFNPQAVSKARAGHGEHHPHFDRGVADARRGRDQSDRIRAEHGESAHAAYTQGHHLMTRQLEHNRAAQPAPRKGAETIAEHTPDEQQWSPMDEAARAATERFAQQGKAFAERAVGGKSGFNGKVTLFKGEDQPGVWAFMGWDGTMGVHVDLARQLSAALDRDSMFKVHHTEMRNPQAILHELIHSIGESEHAHTDSKLAYAHKSTAMIEEGFTELGADQHLADWTRQMGLADRTTPYLTDNAEGRATYGQYAERLAHPTRIAASDSWGAYGPQTAQAQQWVQDVAHLEGHKKPRDWDNRTGRALRKRMQTLSDEVNREAAADKGKALATQVLRVAGIDPNLMVEKWDGTEQPIVVALGEIISGEWLASPDEGRRKPADYVTTARYVAEFETKAARAERAQRMEQYRATQH